MYHLLVMACTETGLCAERWLPQGDRPEVAACIAAAPAVASEWLAAHGMTAGAPAPRCVPTEALPALPMQAVAPGVLVHIGAIATAGPQNGGAIANLGIIEGPSGSVLVETGGNRAEAEALLAAALRLGKPVALAVVTHVHPDHSLGSELMHEAGVPMIGHARLPDALAARRETYATNYRQTIGEAAWHGSGFAPPDRTIAAPETVEAGGLSLVLTPLRQAAHSDSDLTVWHPASGTLFTGDLAFRGLTPTLDGSVVGWLDWLDSPQAPRVLVPGHGPVAASWAEGTQTARDYLAALAAAWAVPAAPASTAKMVAARWWRGTSSSSSPTGSTAS